MRWHANFVKNSNVHGIFFVSVGIVAAAVVAAVIVIVVRCYYIMLFLLPSPAAMMFAVYSCKMNVNLYKLSQTHTHRERKTDSVKPFNKGKTICFHILLHEFHRIYPNNCCHHRFLLNMINSNAIRLIPTTSNLALIYLTLYSLLPSADGTKWDDTMM